MVVMVFFFCSIILIKVKNYFLIIVSGYLLLSYILYNLYIFLVNDVRCNTKNVRMIFRYDWDSRFCSRRVCYWQCSSRLEPKNSTDVSKELMIIVCSLFFFCRGCALQNKARIVPLISSSICGRSMILYWSCLCTSTTMIGLIVLIRWSFFSVLISQLQASVYSYRRFVNKICTLSLVYAVT